MTEQRCDNKSGKVQAVYLFNCSDLKTVNGTTIILKRKYGKFKRPVLKLVK